jgi:hypothetical protein
MKAKMKKIVLIIILIVPILLTSCNRETIIYYSYENVVITRIDKGKNTSLYYGNIKRNEIPTSKPSVVVDWSFDDSLFGFILFSPDKVEILSGGGGNYENVGENSHLNYSDYNNIALRKILDRFAGKPYKNLYQISGNLDLEIKRNEAFGSKVTIKIEK